MNKLILFFVVAAALYAMGQQVAPQRPAGGSSSVKKLAFEVNHGSSWSDIFVMASPNAKPKRLVAGLLPAWSPDGDKIAYCIREGFGFGQIQLINPDGSGHTQLTNLKGGACSPDWSPDGQKLVFTADYGTSTTSIFVMNSNGGSATKITAGYGARWSPDGNQILFCRRTEGRAATGSIWIANSDGTGVKKVIEGRSFFLQAVWFPDGKSIVFSSERERGQGSALFRVNLDGTGLEVFATNKRGALYFPVLSPDGHEIVADSYPTDSRYQLQAEQAGIDMDVVSSVVLLDLVNHQKRVLAQGKHPSVVWEKP